LNSTFRVKAVHRVRVDRGSSRGDDNHCDCRNHEHVQNDHEKVESGAIVAAPPLVGGPAFDRAGLERPLDIGSSDRDIQTIRIELSCSDPLMSKS
jgi:hypothetical protein